MRNQENEIEFFGPQWEKYGVAQGHCNKGHLLLGERFLDWDKCGMCFYCETGTEPEEESEV